MIVNPQNLRGIYVGFNTLFNKALTTVDPLYKQIATVTPSTTDSETYAWLGDIPGMREWIGDREIQNLTASGYTIRNKDFELTIGIDRTSSSRPPSKRRPGTSSSLTSSTAPGTRCRAPRSPSSSPSSPGMTPHGICSLPLAPSSPSSTRSARRRSS